MLLIVEVCIGIRCDESIGVCFDESIGIRRDESIGVCCDESIGVFCDESIGVCCDESIGVCCDGCSACASLVFTLVYSSDFIESSIHLRQLQAFRLVNRVLASFTSGTWRNIGVAVTGRCRALLLMGCCFRTCR